MKRRRLDWSAPTSVMEEGRAMCSSALLASRLASGRWKFALSYFEFSYEGGSLVLISRRCVLQLSMSHLGTSQIDEPGKRLDADVNWEFGGMECGFRDLKTSLNEEGWRRRWGDQRGMTIEIAKWVC